MGVGKISGKGFQKGSKMRFRGIRKVLKVMTVRFLKPLRDLLEVAQADMGFPQETGPQGLSGTVGPSAPGPIQRLYIYIYIHTYMYIYMYIYIEYIYI
jgi:hypothetical protein